MTDGEEREQYRGKMVAWYDLLLDNVESDIDFYLNLCRRNVGRILELGCGTGRLLIPVREAGIDVEGIDISEKMLTRCREKLAEKDLDTPLYHGDIAAFDTGKRYDLIFAAGGVFQMIPNFDNAARALDSIKMHLKPGGEFVMDFFEPEPYMRLLDARKGEWSKEAEAERETGERFEYYENSWYDPESRTIRGRYKYVISKNGEVLYTDIKSSDRLFFGIDEFSGLLEKHGFSDIRTDRNKTIVPQMQSVVFYARR